MAHTISLAAADVVDPAWIPLEVGDLIWLRRPAAVDHGAVGWRQELPGIPARRAEGTPWNARRESEDADHPLSREAFVRFVDRLFA